MVPGTPVPGERILYYTGERSVKHVNVGTIGHVDWGRNGYAPNPEDFVSNMPYVEHVTSWRNPYQSVPLAKVAMTPELRFSMLRENIKLGNRVIYVDGGRVDLRNAKDFIRVATRPLWEAIRSRDRI